MVARGTIRGVLGGVAVFLVIVAIALVIWRRRRQSHRRTSVGPSSLGEVIPEGTQVTVTPFNPTGSIHTDSPPPLVSVPVGLSSKELARLRSPANVSRSQPMDGRPSDPPLITTAERDALGDAVAVATSSSEARILRSEVNVLRNEVQRLHEEISESPPSYASRAE